MDTWKEALWLAKFELKKSLKSFFMFIVALLFLSIFFTTTMPEYLEKGLVGLDLFFLIAFGTVAGWVKQKEFQLQKMSGDLWASPFFITLNQLPITRDVLAKSRFIIYFIYSIPFNLLLLILLYVLSPELRMVMPIYSYIAFSFIWMSYGIYFGLAFPAADAGDQMGLIKQIIYTILFFFGIIAVLVIFQLLYGDGLVSWTMMVARKWPISSMIVSIVATIIGIRYWKSYIFKKMREVDYLT